MSHTSSTSLDQPSGDPRLQRLRRVHLPLRLARLAVLVVLLAQHYDLHELHGAGKLTDMMSYDDMMT
jgi:hypothetical protein